MLRNVFCQFHLHAMLSIDAAGEAVRDAVRDVAHDAAHDVAHGAERDAPSCA